MLKKSASFVLASLRGSTCRSVRLTSSFTAALLDGPFEHPDKYHKQPTPLLTKKKEGERSEIMSPGSLSAAGGCLVQFLRCEGARSVWLV